MWGKGSEIMNTKAYYKDGKGEDGALGEPDGGTASRFQSISSTYFFRSL